jgi:hypothetical protein
LIEAGTSFATALFAAGVDDVCVIAEPDELELLLLPQPTTAATQATASGAIAQLLQLRI